MVAWLLPGTSQRRAVGMTSLLVLSCLATCASGLPRLFPAPIVTYAPSAVYQYRYTAPQQTKEETRGPLGGVTGSYSVAYPGGGLLTQTYAYPAPAALFRTTEQGPLGPAGTLVSLRASFDNSKQSVFLVEMLEQQLGERAPAVVTHTDAVLIEALPVFSNSKESEDLTSLKLDSEAAGGLRRQELQVRDPGDAVVVDAGAGGASAGPAPFHNSKESQALRVFRVQALREGLVAREPPTFGPDSVVVEAAAIPQQSAETAR